MKADFTLVPIGGLGNRIYAICSAIVFCKQENKSLEIIWFKDHGCNCSVKELFSIAPQIKNVTLRDAKFSDLILRDNPRRRNLWIPKFFQQFMYDRRIYTEEACDVISYFRKPDFGNLNLHKHILMVNHYKYWESPDMWKAIVINNEIKSTAQSIINQQKAKRKVGIHIRRTDNSFSVQESPIELFVKKIEEEIKQTKGDVIFFLASDSTEVKSTLISQFANYIVTFSQVTSRNNKQGIIDAFIELNTLALTNMIYATYNSSFSELSHFLGETDFEVLRDNKKQL